jgi:nitroimidazol reductase NimA-like FMN-containing flavoprotein (pyridoxamine 5'-phosphate oxidase superfamily)
MAAARYYWVCTVSPEGRPHATPVDGLWLDDRLYFGGSPATRRNRNLGANPAVCIHLENGLDVVILHGEAQALRHPEHALAVRLSEASAQKYGYAPKPEEYQANEGTFVFRPRIVYAWKQFPKDVTRWRFS